MTTVRVLPYDMFSEGAKALATKLGAKRIRLEGSKLKGRPAIKVINWGSSKVENPELSKCSWLNHPKDVAITANKRKFFEAFKDFSFFVPWTTERDKVMEWLANGDVVFARTSLTGHSGEGIVEMDPNDPNTWLEAPLYTKYIKKKSEFRVHFMNGKIIDIQKKALRADHRGEANHKIRNHKNGFIYAREFGETPEKVLFVSEEFIKVTPLFFGAIDIIYNERANAAYILEVNTAPGLTGTTVDKYAEAFKRELGDIE